MAYDSDRGNRINSLSTLMTLNGLVTQVDHGVSLRIRVPVSRSSALPNPAIGGSAFLNTPGFVDAEVGLAEGNGFLYWNTG